MSNMGKLRRNGLIWVLVCVGISAVWGTSITRSGCAWIDFRAVYAGTRCLIHQHNPYNVSDLEREYLSEDGQHPQPSPFASLLQLQCITLYVNLPTTFVLVAPFAALSWGPAHILWMLVTGCIFALAILLMWNAGASHAPRVSTFLACVIAVNCETIFIGGNTAGIVVGLCGIAVWCFLQNRFVWIGVLCLGLSLAIKPHDAGLVWLYFVLAGGGHRKRALQSAAVTAVICLAAALWVSHVAPNWMHDWNANLATISAPGGINEPGPNAVTTKDGSLYTIVDLQGAISIFRDSPHFYNIVSYLFCGALLLVWSIWTLRTRLSVAKAWLALAAVVPLTLLINYHRLWDAKLVMLAIPACCLLWAEGGPRGKVAIWITSIAAFMTGEISLVLFGMVSGSLHVNTNGILAQAITVALFRPASLALLAMGVFYLWTYVGHAGQLQPASSNAGH
jgi:hypothetical protein